MAIGDTATGLELTYFPWHQDVFFSGWDRYRYKVIAKGRRLGFTRSTAQVVIEHLLGANDLNIWTKDKDKLYVLWGDTTHDNIIKYFNRYFEPILQQLQKKIVEAAGKKGFTGKFQLYRWSKKEKTLIVENGDKIAIVDFRSADRPENWEGFGYDLIVLNEAGIILKNRSLWENSVAPMMLDNPNSKAVIGGVPKGKNLFYELWKRGASNEYPRWKNYKYSSYDNPLLTDEDIEELKKGMSEKAIRQEIYGEFVDDIGKELFSYDEVAHAMRMQIAPAVGLTVWGLDVARHGDDYSVLAKRHGKYFYELKEVQINDTMKLAEWVANEYSASPSDKKPDTIYVDIIGMGWGVHDRLKQLGLPVFPVNVAESSVSERFLNKRAEMYFRLKEEHIGKGGNLPNNPKLLMELTNTEYEYTDKGKIKIIDKKKIKEELGYSPDRADAVALTYAQPVDEMLLKRQKTKRVKKKFTAGV